MIIVIRPKASKEQIAEVISEVEKLGYTPAPIHGAMQTVVAAIGDERTHANLESLTALPQVESVLRVQKRYKLASRESHPENTVVSLDGLPPGPYVARARIVLDDKTLRVLTRPFIIEAASGSGAAAPK